MCFRPWWTRSAHSVYKRSRRPALKLARLLLHHHCSPLHQPNLLSVLAAAGLLRFSSPTVRVWDTAWTTAPVLVAHATVVPLSVLHHQQPPTPQHPTTRNRASRVDAVQNSSPQGAAAPGSSASGRPPLVARAPPVGSPPAPPPPPNPPPVPRLCHRRGCLEPVHFECSTGFCNLHCGSRRCSFPTIRREMAGVRRCGRARREPFSPSTSLASTPLAQLRTPMDARQGFCSTRTSQLRGCPGLWTPSAYVASCLRIRVRVLTLRTTHWLRRLLPHSVLGIWLRLFVSLLVCSQSTPSFQVVLPMSGGPTFVLVVLALVTPLSSHSYLSLLTGVALLWSTPLTAPPTLQAPRSIWSLCPATLPMPTSLCTKATPAVHSAPLVIQLSGQTITCVHFLSSLLSRAPCPDKPVLVSAQESLVRCRPPLTTDEQFVLAALQHSVESHPPT